MRATIITPIRTRIARRTSSDWTMYSVAFSSVIYPIGVRIQPIIPTLSAPVIFLINVIMPEYDAVGRSPVANSATSTVSAKIIQGIICAPPKPSPIRNETIGTRIAAHSPQEGSRIARKIPPIMYAGKPIRNANCFVFLFIAYLTIGNATTAATIKGATMNKLENSMPKS